LLGADIVAQGLGLLRPDDRINLKEPRILGMPFATQDLPVLRKLLARAFALGNPLEHGRQRVILHHNHVGLWHHLRDRTACVPQRDGRAQEDTDTEQQPAQHEDHQAAYRPRPPTTATECADTGSHTSGRKDLSGCPETMERGSLHHRRSLGMREPSRRRSSEEDHDAVSSGRTARALARFPVPRVVRGAARAGAALYVSPYSTT